MGCGVSNICEFSQMPMRNVPVDIPWTAKQWISQAESGGAVVARAWELRRSETLTLFTIGREGELTVLDVGSPPPQGQPIFFTTMECPVPAGTDDAQHT